MTAPRVGPAALYCNISGFDTNPPYVEYSWSFGDKEIVNDVAVYELRQDGEGIPELDTKYTVVFQTEGSLSLIVHDLGEYFASILDQMTL